MQKVLILWRAGLPMLNGLAKCSPAHGFAIGCHIQEKLPVFKASLLCACRVTAATVASSSACNSWRLFILYPQRLLHDCFLRLRSCRWCTDSELTPWSGRNLSRQCDAFNGGGSQRVDVDYELFQAGDNLEPVLFPFPVFKGPGSSHGLGEKHKDPCARKRLIVVWFWKLNCLN